MRLVLENPHQHVDYDPNYPLAIRDPNKTISEIATNLIPPEWQLEMARLQKIEKEALNKRVALLQKLRASVDQTSEELRTRILEEHPEAFL